MKTVHFSSNRNSECLNIHAQGRISIRESRHNCRDRFVPADQLACVNVQEQSCFSKQWLLFSVFTVPTGNTNDGMGQKEAEQGLQPLSG